MRNVSREKKGSPHYTLSGTLFSERKAIFNYLTSYRYQPLSVKNMNQPKFILDIASGEVAEWLWRCV